MAPKSGSKTKAASSGKTAAAKKQPVRPKPKPPATKHAVDQAISDQAPRDAEDVRREDFHEAQDDSHRQAEDAGLSEAEAEDDGEAKGSRDATEEDAAASAPAETRRFAWAPVDGAVGYHVELFRGNDRVLARDTKQPVLELAPTWRYQGRTVKLTPGEYRWYVWPVTAERTRHPGGRPGEAHRLAFPARSGAPPAAYTEGRSDGDLGSPGSFGGNGW